MQIKEGKIVEAWNAWDFLGVVIEVGAFAEDGLVRALQGDQQTAPHS